MSRISSKFLKDKQSLFESSNFESGAISVTSFDDGANYVDGDGGSPSAITYEINTSDPLLGNSDLKINKSATSSVGEGVSVLTRTIPKAWRGRKMWFRFEYDATHANYVSSDVVLKAYDVTNSEEIGVIPLSGLDSNNGLLKMRAKAGAYMVPKPTCEKIRISFYSATDNASASAWSIYVDGLELSPEATVPGAIVTQPQSYTPIFTGFGTPTNVAVSWCQVGGNLEIWGSFTPGTTTGDVASISLPNNLTLPTVATSQFYGWLFRSAGVGFYRREFVLIGESGATALKIGNVADAEDGASDPSTPLNGSGFAASGNTLRFSASIPMTNFKASAALTTTEIGLQTVQVLAEKNSGTHTSSGNRQDITSWTEVKDNWNCFDATTGVFTAPKPMTVNVDAGVVFAANGTGNRNISVIKNGSVIRDGTNTTGANSSGVSTSLSVNLAKGDTLKFQGFQSSGGNLNYEPNEPLTRISITEVPDFTTFAAFKDNADVELWMDTPSGHGSTATRIRYFPSANIRKQTGNGVYYTLSTDATNGTSVTINVPGRYHVRYADRSTVGASTVGISVNASSLTTNNFSLSYASGFRGVVSSPSLGNVAEASGSFILAAGDVVRPHTDTAPNDTSQLAYFQLIRIGD